MNQNAYYESCYEPTVQAYNDDKPHRCPACHTVAVWGSKNTRKFVSTRLLSCYRCQTRFTRWPRLTRLWLTLGRIYTEPIVEDAL